VKRSSLPTPTQPIVAVLRGPGKISLSFLRVSIPLGASFPTLPHLSSSTASALRAPLSRHQRVVLSPRSHLGICPTADYRIFQVNSVGDLTLENLTARHGNVTSGSGGGILNYGTLTVMNSILSENAASGYGGAITTFQGGTVTVMDSTVITNKAVNPTTGGGWGGGISNYNGTLLVMRSTISGNTANDLGGGIHNREGSLTITDTTLSYNSSRTGGGIYNFVNDTLNINRSSTF
jgi:hypothetical protein